MKKAKAPETIKVSARELLFIKKNWPSGLPARISDALTASGRDDLTRWKVHRELTTIKDEYDKDVILKAREIIEVTKGVKFNPED